MCTDKYEITIIIPVYNAEKTLRRCLDSVVGQDFPIESMQVILINDGSEDKSSLIMEEYKRSYPNTFLLINKENEGVSATRNLGIQKSEGRYIMYLDSDDTITTGTVSSIVSFFNDHYDEIDLMTYDQVSIIDGIESGRHYRYNTFTHTGVYDLTEFSNAFASITNISVVVKNLFDKNIFFNESLKAHEDMFYCTNILCDKMKIGFTSDGCYEYHYNSVSAVHTIFYAYYIFEQTISSWEKLFARFESNVPYYIQALFLNDISWKMRSDILMPYHYDPSQFKKAKNRILALLKKVEDLIIVLHPGVDKFHQQYFLRAKNGGEDINFSYSPAGYVATRNDEVLFFEKKIELVLQKFKVADGRIEIMAYLKSQFFSIGLIPRLFIRRNGGELVPVTIGESSWDYYKSKTKTNKFYGFRLTLDTRELESFEFLVEVNGKKVKPAYYFMPQVFFDHERTDYFKDGYKISFLNGTFLLRPSTESDYKAYKKNIKKTLWHESKKIWLIKSILLLLPRNKREIWLYSDAKGVQVDNAFYQFHHDLSQHDESKRFYITSFPRKSYRRQLSFRQRNKLVRRGSWRHKFLYLRASKVIAAFIELDNYSPFNEIWQHNYMDAGSDPDLVYLQHGVLHAHCPWKYSLDRVLVQKEVISTVYEKRNMIENYLFDEEHLLPAGMPRYDYIDQNETGSDKILFAPSWRKYLIGYEDDNWSASPKTFLASDFYRETKAFLHSKKLHDLLERYDFTLDFKLHPIFEVYKKYYQIDHERINIAPASIPATEYKIFITDFSSFVYDFAYLKRAIIYFNPDYKLFLSGMNDYRELDLPYEEAFGPFVQNAQEALVEIERLLKQGTVPDAKYMERMEGLFFYEDNNQCQRIYEALAKK